MVNYQRVAQAHEGEKQMINVKIFIVHQQLDTVNKDLVKRCNKYLVSKIMMDSSFNKYLVKYLVKYMVNTWIFLVKYLVKRCYSTG